MNYRNLNKQLLIFGWMCLLIISHKNYTPVLSAGSRLVDKKICIDPGHGGSDPGAVNLEFGLTDRERYQSGCFLWFEISA